MISREGPLDLLLWKTIGSKILPLQKCKNLKQSHSAGPTASTSDRSGFTYGVNPEGSVVGNMDPPAGRDCYRREAGEHHLASCQPSSSSCSSVSRTICCALAAVASRASAVCEQKNPVKLAVSYSAQGCGSTHQEFSSRLLSMITTLYMTLVNSVQ